MICGVVCGYLLFAWYFILVLTVFCLVCLFRGFGLDAAVVCVNELWLFVVYAFPLLMFIVCCYVLLVCDSVFGFGLLCCLRLIGLGVLLCWSGAVVLLALWFD